MWIGNRIGTTKKLWIGVCIALCYTLIYNGFGPTNKVEAQVTITLLDVIQVEGYKNVLELDDRLILYTYAVVENIPTGYQTLGRPAGIATAKVNGNGIKQQNPPILGYSLGSFYWGSDTSSVMPFGDATAQVALATNPLLFASSNTDFANVVWNSSNSLDDTADALEDDIKSLLRGIESADPDIEQGAYVSSRGVTPLGMVLVGYSFPLLSTISPDAFEISQSSIATDDHSFKVVGVGGIAIPQHTETQTIAPNTTSSDTDLILGTVVARNYYGVNMSGISVQQDPDTDPTNLNSTVINGCTIAEITDPNDPSRVFDRVSCTNLNSLSDNSYLRVSWHSDATITGQSSTFTQSIKTGGERLGLHFNASRLLMVVLVMGGLLFIVLKTGGEPMSLLIFSGPALFWAGLVGAIPMAIVIAILAVLIVAGSAPIFSRIFN